MPGEVTDKEATLMCLVVSDVITPDDVVQAPAHCISFRDGRDRRPDLHIPACRSLRETAL